MSSEQIGRLQGIGKDKAKRDCEKNQNNRQRIVKTYFPSYQAECRYCFQCLVIANLLLAGLRFALFSSPNNNAIMGSVQVRLYGIASSILGTMRLVGQAMSMSIVTLLIGMFIGRVPLNAADPTALLTTMRASFILFTALCLLGIAASLSRGRIRKENGEEQTV